MRLRPIGKVTVAAEARKRRRARLLAQASDALELYRRIDDVRKNGGTPLAEIRQQVDARLATERAASRRSSLKRRRKR